MDGGNDPENRAPMDWQKCSKETETRILLKAEHHSRNKKHHFERSEFQTLDFFDSSSYPSRELAKLWMIWFFA